jgi:hypothetical protein
VHGVSVVSPADPRGRPATPGPSRLPGWSVKQLRPDQGADIGGRVAVDEQIGVIAGRSRPLPSPRPHAAAASAIAHASAATVLTPPSTRKATETGSSGTP